MEGAGSCRLWTANTSLWMVDGNMEGKSKAMQIGGKSFKMLAHEDVFRMVARVIRCHMVEDHLSMFSELGDVKQEKSYKMGE